VFAGTEEKGLFRHKGELMVGYQPAYRHPALARRIGQDAPAANGTKKAITTLVTLAVLSSAAYASVLTATKSKGLLQVAGYVGGVGVALLGLATLGNVIGAGEYTKPLMTPFSLTAA
jgi:hypothetical protein